MEETPPSTAAVVATEEKVEGVSVPPMDVLPSTANTTLSNDDAPAPLLPPSTALVVEESPSVPLQFEDVDKEAAAAAVATTETVVETPPIAVETTMEQPEVATPPPSTAVAVVQEAPLGSPNLIECIHDSSLVEQESTSDPDGTSHVDDDVNFPSSNKPTTLVSHMMDTPGGGETACTEVTANNVTDADIKIVSVGADNDATREDSRDSTEKTSNMEGIGDEPAEKVNVEPKKEMEHGETSPAERKEEEDNAPPPPPPPSDQTDAASTADTSPSLAQSKGAQILMNRFSTWRMTANENAASLLSKTQANAALQENAKQAQEIAQRMRMRFLNPNAKQEAPAREEPATNNEEDKKMVAAEQSAEPKNDGGGAVAASAGEQNDDAESLERKESQDSKSTFDSKTTYSSAPGDISSAMDDETYSEATSAEGTSTTTTTTNTPYTRERMRAVLTRASVASSVMAESVATFRGRYTVGASTADDTNDPSQQKQPERTPTPESQVALILKSRAGEHMQEILNQLEDHEFAMLLGRGMLGVNLKQCYLKNHGIFVDYLVVGGQAQQSGLIRPGDLLVRLGDYDLRKGTIMEVPHEIAKAKRPSVLVMSTGTTVPLERVNYVDVAVAMMHRARKFYHKQGSPSVSSSALKPGPDDGKTGINSVMSPEKEEKSDDPISTPKSVCNVTIPVHDSVESFISPPWPNIEVRKEFIDEVPLRCLDKFVVSDLCQFLDMDSNFRAAIQNAFLVCALDSRRMPFLARHLSGEEFQDDAAAEKTTSGSMTPSAQLMLFLELASFMDLYNVTPVGRLRETASRIAYKFFLPTKIGNRLQPPLFDFHHIVPDASLRHLEFVLSGKSQNIPRDLFLDFQRSVVDSLTAAPFLSFLSSADCSRMRAYLRDTSPFVNLSLKPMIEAISVKKGDNAAATTGETSLSGPAKNCVAYLLLYLICRMEKEGSGEYNFNLEKEINRRLLGAPNDICCCIFIKRTLLPALQYARSNASNEGEAIPEPGFENLLQVVERFWELYVADTLELCTKSTEIESTYGKIRQLLQGISQEAYANPSRDSKDVVKAILDSNLEDEAQMLADELLYEYAANIHSKFRDHKLHEWMCNELSKVISGDPNWWQKQTIPNLPNGCVKRLLRKIDFPVGISTHKPYKVTPTVESTRQYHNADWAVVFGSCVGTELASQMPVPGLGSLDVRRYTCLPVALDQEHHYDDFRPEEVLPATFESYAVVPPSKLKPFRSLVDAGRVSVDGWEVSLVTFAMPNGDSGSSGDAMESALYGVSLCFQRPAVEDARQFHAPEIPTEICNNEEKEGKQDEKLNEFSSPISFEKVESDGEKVVRKVKTATDLPVFAGRLKEQSWMQRVVEDEHRDPEQPLVIGISLVSRRNVVFAMRDTLSKLLFDYSRHPGQSLDEKTPSLSCGALIHILGTCSYQDHEGATLKALLAPYLQAGMSSWVDRPIVDQEKAFESHAMKLLTDCLPPIPLALLFVAALLEQKIVLSSSRRSVLHAACSGLISLLRPLKWSHLLVPMVPGALAADLIQYPAPYVLGVPSEDADNMDLLGSLPRDVTLVDLDVGRVILAPNFGQDNEMVRGTSDSDATARALRSQVLYLAQGLGTVFGNSLRPQSWRCDGVYSVETGSDSEAFQRLRDSAMSFVVELLEGAASCCFWIEEQMQAYVSTSEPTVLFDEDKFFEIKNHRATKAWKHMFPKDSNTGALALNLEDFDLILESFLRCQNLSLHINTLPKTEMFYY